LLEDFDFTISHSLFQQKAIAN